MLPTRLPPRFSRVIDVIAVYTTASLVCRKNLAALLTATMQRPFSWTFLQNEKKED